MNKIVLYNKKMVNGDWKGEEIRCMLETSKGEILMGTTQGVYRYEPSTKRMNSFYHEFNQKNCRVLYEDSKKRVWVGTYHDGLYCIDSVEKSVCMITPIRIIRTNWISVIYVL